MMPIITPDQTNGPDGTADVPMMSSLADHHVPGAAASSDPSSRPEGRTTLHPNDASPERPRHRRRRWQMVVAVVVLGAIAGVVAVVAGGDNADDPSAETAAAPTIRAVTAEQRDLAETREVDATLGYRDTVVVESPVDGTVTALVDEDEVIERGDVLYEIDDRPTVVFWGDVPLYRPIGDGVGAGADVEMLEENLVALGFDVDGAVRVDGMFDDATREAIEAWQNDLGVAVDGIVDPADAVVLAGPAVVSTTEARVGSVVRVASAILGVQPTATAQTIGFAADGGRLTAIPAEGARLSTGDIAYEYDTIPVAVVSGDVAFDRRLRRGVSDGEDVRQLEQALSDLGFDAGGDLEVDDHFDDATRRALRRWERRLNLPAHDGEMATSQFVVLAPGSSVLDIEVERGDYLVGDEVVFVAGVSDRVVTASIEADDADLIEIGDTVDVEFADGTLAAGEISDIGNAVTDPQTGESTTPFEVVVAEIPETTTSDTVVDVTVIIVEDLAAGATVVPAEAIVSVGDGTFAVEVVEGSTTSFVGVETGLFADGFVEVIGLEPGTAVVVPE